MALPTPEIELLPAGLVSDGPKGGSFELNTLQRRGGTEVRRGFGVVAERDLQMRNRPLVFGDITAILGSHPIRTDFGHDQVLTLLKAEALTANSPEYSRRIGVTVLSIEDLDTGECWQEVLHPHTGSGEGDLPYLQDRHGVYESALMEDRQAWARATDKQPWFVTWRGRVYFGNPDIGTWLYRPAIFNGTRDRSIDTAHQRLWAVPYSEWGHVTPVIPTEGLFPAAYTYLEAEGYPRPIAAAAVDGRLALASGREVYFTEVGRPQSIIADNFISVDSSTPITAMAEVAGHLVIASHDRVWVYRPSTGDVVSGGVLEEVEAGGGCFSPLSMTRMRDGVVWLGPRGVYFMGPSLQPQRLSEEVDRFFTDGYINNPLFHYYTESGGSTGGPSVTSGREGTLIHKERSLPASVCYHPDLDLLLCTLPLESSALAFSGGKWSMWSWRSVVALDGASPAVGIVDNFTTDDGSLFISPEDARGAGGIYPMSLPGRLMLAAGVNDDGIVDAALLGGDGGPPLGGNGWLVTSYVVCEYGRGGAVDRSALYEDRRVIHGAYRIADDEPDTTHCFYVDPPIPIEEGVALPGGEVAPADCFLVPIAYVNRETSGALVTPIFSAGVDEWGVTLRFDRTHWTPVYRGATAEVAFMVPAERIGSITGYEPGAPVAATREVRVYETAGSTASQAGFELRIRFDGGTASGTWTHTPYINLTCGRKEVLLYIPMARVAGGTDEVSGMGWEFRVTDSAALYTSRFRDTAGNTVNITRWAVYDQWFLRTPRHDTNDLKQAVDWAVLQTIDPKNSTRMRCRGVKVLMESHGRGLAANLIGGANWPYGVLNVLIGDGERVWAAQMVDLQAGHPSIDTHDDLEPFGKVILDINGALRLQTFDPTTAGYVTYGDPTDGTVGTVLASSRVAREVHASMLARGRGITVMAYGFHRDKAHFTRLESLRALIRPEGPSPRRQTDAGG